jgi:hypothetical protein
VLAKIVYAGVSNTSYEQGSRALLELAELTVSAKQVERVTDRIGMERCAERDAEVKAYQELPLVERKGVPAGVVPPEVAVVGDDGGRMQIWERAGATTAAEAEPLEPEDGRTGTHWRENKVGVVLQMKSPVSATDPCPEIPETFVDPTKILRLARELKAKTAPREDAVRDPPDAEDSTAAESTYEWKPPEITQRTLVASRCCWAEFGPKLAQAAWSQGFFGALRRAFIGDGSENNWTLWRNYFSSFVPILDFIHALSYVFAAATAGRPFTAGWSCYVRWITWMWQGQVEQIIAELAARQVELGMPAEDEAETSSKKIVAKALTYLQNHKDKMRYAEYRRQGLPIMSSYVESAVKQFNFRVKGTEKFWSEAGAEGVLQLRADDLSEDKPLPAFWERRQNATTGQRTYRRAA